MGPTTLPTVEIAVAASANNLKVLPGTAATITGRATDTQGDLEDHWLEIQNPDGQWSWEGWLTETAWSGGLVGNSFESNKSASFTFPRPGTYLVRSTAIGGNGVWVISSLIFVEVIDPASPGN